MRISLVQSDIIWGDPAANRRHLDELLGDLPATDLLVLPEMFSTGFATSPEGIAEEQVSGAAGCETESVKWMKELALRRGCAVAGSVATSRNGCYFNRFSFVKPDGSVISYDKRHLFTYSGEDKVFTPGKDRVVVEWKGVRFLLLVCYDLRFPVWIRSRRDYDAIICVASWPTVRRKAWDTLLRARAIENQCFVAAVDRTGNDPSCVYNGGSALIDPYGNDIVSAPDGLECVVSGDIDMDVLSGFREKFPVLDDADDFKME